jgi:hypothetical protein
MNASKENCRTALQYFDRLSGPLDVLQHIEGLLKACERNLPTEAAVKRDKARRRIVADGLAATRRGV